MLNRCNQCIIEPIGTLVINSHSILTLLESRESKGIGFQKLIFFGDIAKEWMDIPPPCIILCVPVYLCMDVCSCIWTHASSGGQRTA